jgi:hypothetical protein
MSRLCCAVLSSALALAAPVAAAAQPTLALATVAVPPGTAVAVTVTGVPGRHFAVIGSATNAGFTYGGVSLAVGADLAVLAQGVLDGTGSAVVPVTPPFVGTSLDRYYLQAVTSASAAFVPLEASSGRVVRNRDSATGILDVYTARAYTAAPTASYSFLSPTVTVTVAAGQRLHVTAARAFGSTTAQGGIGLTLQVCVRATTPGSLMLRDNEAGINGIRVASGTRVLQTLSHVFDALPVGTYEAGLCGYVANLSWVGTWNDNGLGDVTAFVFQ